jgi:hypothetical protein
MPTHTKRPPTSSRLGRRPATESQSRFHRPGQPARAARTSRTGRPTLPGRRKPQKSTTQKALSAVTGALPHSSSSKKKSSGKRTAGGMALLAGGIGLLMKNRDKLPGMSSRKANKAAEQAARPAPQPGPPPSPNATPTPGTPI